MGKPTGNHLGKQFGRWTVLARAGSVRFGGAAWLCRCSCGLERIVRAKHLCSGKSYSCGCYQRDQSRQRGAWKAGAMTAEYRAWRDLRRRCQSPNHPLFPSYGGRGITVCARWASFENFLEDMGLRPPGMSIDRIDNNLLVDSYSKGNCRWTTKIVQARNKRSTKLTEGAAREIRERHELGELQSSLAKRFGVNDSTVRAVLKNATWRLSDAGHSLQGDH